MSIKEADKNKKNHSPSSSSSSRIAANEIKYAYLVLLLGVVLLLKSPFATAQTGDNNHDLPTDGIISSTNSNNNNNSNYDFDDGYDNSMSIMAAVIISAFFVVGFFAIFLRQCISDQGGLVMGTDRGVTERSRMGVRGIDPSVIETFPIFLYSDVKEHKIGKGALECAVCLNEFEDEDTLRLLPKCDHVFHPECIDAWLASHVTCPVCRANLKPVPGELATGVGGGGGGVGGGATELPGSESEHRENGQLSIAVMDGRQSDIINPNEIQIQNRPARSSPILPRNTGNFPRSHSTGHSLVLPGENIDRFTLRLPDEVKFVRGKLNRATSSVAEGDGSVSGGSTGRGYYGRGGGGGGGGGGEGSSRGRNYRFVRLLRGGKSDQTVFSIFTRPSPGRSPQINLEDHPETSRKASNTSVKTPFDCLEAKSEGSESPSARLCV